MDDSKPSPTPELLTLTAEIIEVYVSNNPVPTSELPILISSLYAALTSLTGTTPAEAPAFEKATPAQIRSSITRDALISFEDGKPYKTLRRHLTTRGFTPEAYREKWGLPSDYPMTSSAYSSQRSQLAKNLGLGRKADT